MGKQNVYVRYVTYIAYDTTKELLLNPIVNSIFK